VKTFKQFQEDYTRVINPVKPVTDLIGAGLGAYELGKKAISGLSNIFQARKKGKFQRKGYGSKLLNKLEDEAKKEGLDSLYTEASLISYELFLKNEWKTIRKEKVIINNIFFERYKMTKTIKS